MQKGYCHRVRIATQIKWIERMKHSPFWKRCDPIWDHREDVHLPVGRGAAAKFMFDTNF